MNTILKLYSKTFSRVPHIGGEVTKIQKRLYKDQVMAMVDLELSACMVHLQQIIYSQVAEIQAKKSIQVIDRFQQKYDGLQYDYDKKTIIFHQKRGNNQLTFKTKSIFVERFDHPFWRQTLYLHQMPNASKYLTIPTIKQFPKYMQDFQRKHSLDLVLDQVNPLGIPYWSQPLGINIEVRNGSKTIGFDLQTKLGKALIKRSYNYQNQNKFQIDPYYLDSKMNQYLLSFLSQKTGINQAEIQQFSKLAFIGGSVEKLEMLLDTFEYISAQLMNQ